MTANGGNGSSWIRRDKRLAIYLRDGFRCLYCNRDLHGADPFDITLDHLDGKHKAGHHGARNLVTACRGCNSSRQQTKWRIFALFFMGSRIGVSGDMVVLRITRHRRRKLARYRKLAKELLEAGG